jgi:transmembrane sensor
MDNDDIKLLLVRYITGEVTDAELAEIKHWISLHPENELYFVELYEAWQNMLYLKPEVIDDEKAYQLLLSKIAPQKKPLSAIKKLRIAAVLAVFLLSSIALLNLLNHKTENNHRVSTQQGAVKKITLDDGTIVWLNAGSAIKYDTGFGKTNRTIYLEGEAFFDVGHNNRSIPFLVNTKNYTIRDIGTKFNLKAYPNDPFFETTVIKGEVAIEGNHDKDSHAVNRMYIKPHQVLKIFYHPENANKNKKDGPVVSQKAFNEMSILQIDSAKLNIYDGWKDDLLVFDGSTLAEIFIVLERRYNVKIALDNAELQNIKYYGSFKHVPTIDKVLHIIKQNTPINYTIYGQNVTIKKATDHLKN